MSFDLDDYTHLLKFAREAHTAGKVGVIYATETADWWRGS